MDGFSESGETGVPAFLEKTPDGLTILDHEVRIRFEGSQNLRIHGYEPDELIGRSLFDFLHPDDAERLAGRVAALDPGGIDGDTVRFRHRNGHWLHLEGRLRDCRDVPSINGYLGLFRDVTERIVRYDRVRAAWLFAERASLRLRRLLDHAACELGERLERLHGSIEELRQGGVPADPRWEAAFRQMQWLEQWAGGSGMRENLRSEMKLPAGGMADLAFLASSRVTLLQSRARQRGVKLIWENGSSTPGTPFDASLMTKILDQLLEGALEEVEPGGSILVTAEITEDEGDPCVHFILSGGVLLPGEIASGLIELLGGNVETHGGPGESGHLTVRFPAPGVDAPRRPRPQAGSRASGSTTDPGMHVLLLAAEADARAAIKRTFDGPYRVVEVSSATEAMNRLREQPFGVVLAETTLPEPDGLGICRSMQADPALAAIPVLLLADQPGIRERQTAILTGAVDCLDRTLPAKELLERVDGVLRSEAPPPSETEDGRFLRKLKRIIRSRMRDPEFSIPELASRLGFSARQFQRRLNELCGESPVAFLRRFRLREAHRLIVEKRYRTLAEIAAAVGMSPAYFSRSYRTQFGEPPDPGK